MASANNIFYDLKIDDADEAPNPPKHFPLELWGDVPEPPDAHARRCLDIVKEMHFARDTWRSFNTLYPKSALFESQAYKEFEALLPTLGLDMVELEEDGQPFKVACYTETREMLTKEICLTPEFLEATASKPPKPEEARDQIRCQAEAIFARPTQSKLTAAFMPAARREGDSEESDDDRPERRDRVEGTGSSETFVDKLVAGQPLPLSSAESSSQDEVPGPCAPSEPTPTTSEYMHMSVYLPPYHCDDDEAPTRPLNAASRRIRCQYRLRVSRDATVASLMQGLRDILARVLAAANPRTKEYPLLQLCVSCEWELYPVSDAFVPILPVHNEQSRRRASPKAVKRPCRESPPLDESASVGDLGHTELAVWVLDTLAKVPKSLSRGNSNEKRPTNAQVDDFMDSMQVSYAGSVNEEDSALSIGSRQRYKRPNEFVRDSGRHRGVDPRRAATSSGLRSITESDGETTSQ